MNKLKKAYLNWKTRDATRYFSERIGAELSRDGFLQFGIRDWQVRSRRKGLEIEIVIRSELDSIDSIVATINRKERIIRLPGFQNPHGALEDCFSRFTTNLIRGDYLHGMEIEGDESGYNFYLSEVESNLVLVNSRYHFPSEAQLPCNNWQFLLFSSETPNCYFEHRNSSDPNVEYFNTYSIHPGGVVFNPDLYNHPKSHKGVYDRMMALFGRGREMFGNGAIKFLNASDIQEVLDLECISAET